MISQQLLVHRDKELGPLNNHEFKFLHYELKELVWEGRSHIRCFRNPIRINQLLNQIIINFKK